MSVAIMDNRVVGIIAEVTAGTFLTPSFDFRARDIKFSEEVEEYVRKNAVGDHGFDASVMGRQAATCSFAIDLAGSGTAGTAPAWRAALLGAGWIETDGTTDVKYTLSKVADCKTCSIEVRDLFCSDNKQQTIKIAGAKASSKIVLDNVGAPLRLELEFKGKLVSVTDETPVFPTLATDVIPPAVIGAAVSVGGIAQNLDKVEINVGEDIQTRTSPSDATGWIHSYIAARETKATIDPEIQLVATDDVIGKLKAGTLGAFSLAAGSTAGNIVTITAPKAQYVAAPSGERNGAVTRDVELRFLRNAGDDDLVITLT
jgi:hypothetical protein